MRALTTAIERVVQAASYALGVLLLIAACINVANVIARYVFRRPFVWGEEIILYLVIWLVFIGLPVAAWRHLHLRMDVVYEWFPRALRRLVGIVIALVTLWLCAQMVFLAWRVIALLQSNNQRSAAAGVPMFLVYWAIPIGFGLLALVSLVQLLGYLSGAQAAETERARVAEELEHGEELVPR
jgi:C4-dicarboxylate transporter DctQ subunit